MPQLEPVHEGAQAVEVVGTIRAELRVQLGKLGVAEAYDRSVLLCGMPWTPVGMSSNQPSSTRLPWSMDCLTATTRMSTSFYSSYLLRCGHCRLEIDHGEGCYQVTVAAVGLGVNPCALQEWQHVGDLD
jgi:hypothetical protein